MSEYREDETRAARREDWKTLPMPEAHAAFILNRAFSEDEMAALRRGNIPQAMEDKWFWYMEGDTLFAHRSWTGYCVYVIDFKEDNRHFVTVNRDPEQYGRTSIEEEAETLNKLLNWWAQTPYDHYNEWLAETCDALKLRADKPESKERTNMKYEIKPMTEEEESLVEDKISEYADSMAPAVHRTKEESLVFKIENEEGKIIAGCKVNVHLWGRAVLAALWTDGNYRHHGLGSMLIRAAENAAREKDCYYLCLGTADFMARPLYEKHGFSVFTVNRDVPMGHISWSLAKRLDKDIPDYVPTDNTAADKYVVVPGTEEDADIIVNGLDDFCKDVVPDKHEYIHLCRKLVDREGNMVAAVICGVDCDDCAELDGIWVEEPYRRQGLGTYLMRETEREAKANGAYVMLSYCCDWASDFFFKNGYTERGSLKDYPKGHTSYEIEKRM